VTTATLLESFAMILLRGSMYVEQFDNHLIDEGVVGRIQEFWRG